MTARRPLRDRPLVLHDLLERIAGLRADGGDPGEVERLAIEYRRLWPDL